MIHVPVAAERNIKTVAEKETDSIYLKAPARRCNGLGFRLHLVDSEL
jgi:hypothetical protein